LNDEINEFDITFGKNRAKGIRFRLLSSGTGVPPIWKGMTLIYTLEGTEE